MATLTESLEARIQQLKTAIETQQRQLAVYEQVLALEQGSSASASLGNKSDPARPAPAAPPAVRPASAAGSGPAFTGNKTEFIAALVQAQGSNGATPKEIDEALAQHGIERGKNLLYSALSGLVKQRKLKKQGDRYVALSSVSSARSKRRAVPPAKPRQSGPAPRSTPRPKTAARTQNSRAPRPAPWTARKTAAAKHATTQTGG